MKSIFTPLMLSIFLTAPVYSMERDNDKTEDFGSSSSYHLEEYAPDTADALEKELAPLTALINTHIDRHVKNFLPFEEAPDAAIPSLSLKQLLGPFEAYLGEGIFFRTAVDADKLTESLRNLPNSYRELFQLITPGTRLFKRKSILLGYKNLKAEDCIYLSQYDALRQIKEDAHNFLVSFKDKFKKLSATRTTNYQLAAIGTLKLLYKFGNYFNDYGDIIDNLLEERYYFYCLISNHFSDLHLRDISHADRIHTTTKVMSEDILAYARTVKDELEREFGADFLSKKIEY